MPAGHSAQTADRAAIHVTKSTSLTNATPVGEVFQDRFQLFRRQFGIEERSSLPLGETDLANAAPEHSPLLVQAVATGDGEVLGPAFAMLGAIGIEAAEV